MKGKSLNKKLKKLSLNEEYNNELYNIIMTIAKEKGLLDV